MIADGRSIHQTEASLASTSND